MTSFLEKFQCACTLSAVGKGGSPAPAVSTCTGGGGGGQLHCPHEGWRSQVEW